MSRREYVPGRGDVVWMTFSPQAGHEQSGRRPAVVISSSIYNGRTGMALCCPVTSQVKGYPFEVLVPPELKIKGAILADHIRNIDWRARRTKYIGQLPESAMDEVSGKKVALITT